jgi:hypothetical protein
MATEGQYKYLSEQISKLGWRRREPANLDIPLEKPRLLRKLAEIHTGVPPNAKQVAGYVCSKVGLIEDILAVHASRNDLPPSEKERISKALQGDAEHQPDNLLRFRRN